MSLQRWLCKLAVLVAPLALVAGGAAPTRAQSSPASDTASLPAPMPVGPALTAPAPDGNSLGNGGATTCAQATCGSCATCGTCTTCQRKDCPPKFVICTPQPPKLKFKCTCPKPVCDPCHLDPTGNYGYTPTCWRPWMAPPNYSHCPIPSPTQLMPNGKVELTPTPVPENPPPSRLETRMDQPVLMLPDSNDVEVSEHPVTTPESIVVPPPPLQRTNSQNGPGLRDP